MDIEIPKKMPLTGKKGNVFLLRLLRRATHLEKRISGSNGTPHFDKAELSALEWLIKKIIIYEKKFAELGINPNE